MPYSFALVNKVSKKFYDAERRYNYTTPKTFLELIKLYKNVLGKKRKETQARRQLDPSTLCTPLNPRLLTCIPTLILTLRKALIALRTV